MIAARTVRVRRGFSLAEMMIALIILGLGLLFIAAALPVGLSYNRDTLDRAMGEAAAEYALDQIELYLRTSQTLIKVHDVDPGPGVANVSVRVDGIFRPRDPTTPRAPRNPADWRDWFLPYSDDEILRLGPPAPAPPPPALNRSGSTVEPFVRVRPLIMGNIDAGPGRRGLLTAGDGEVIIDNWQRAVPLPFPPFRNPRSEDGTGRGPGNQGTAFLPFQPNSIVHRDFIHRQLDAYVDQARLPPPSPPPAPLGYQGQVDTLCLAGREFFNEDPGGNGGDLQYANPVLPAVARVYPPITPDQPFTAAGFYYRAQSPNPLMPYLPRPVSTPQLPGRPFFGLAGSETLKALERRLVWTAFYRRVSYGYPANPPGTPVAVPGDPLTYEVIVVVCRRPSANHRFARQFIAGDPAQGGIAAFRYPRALPQPSPAERYTSDLLAPEPWLILFQSATPVPIDPATRLTHRLPQGPEPNRLAFLAYPDPEAPRLTRIIVPGSILIPAVNRLIRAPFPPVPPPAGDVLDVFEQLGFTPYGPDVLPIYEVTEVVPGATPSDSTAVVVRNVGTYPTSLTSPPPPQQPAFLGNHFPFWTIPPAFAERDGDGQPRFERHTPVVRVARRVIRIPEVQ